MELQRDLTYGFRFGELKVGSIARKPIARWDILNKYIRTSNLYGTYKSTLRNGGFLPRYTLVAQYPLVSSVHLMVQTEE